MLKFFKNNRFFNPAVLLALIILAQSALILYYADKKKNFYMDEIGTLLTANNSEMPGTGYLKVLEVGRLYSGKDLKSAITVDAGERFKFGFVKKNLLLDPMHVPIYFFSVHVAYAVYSFFSDSFSIYPGILLNLIFFIFISILLYKAACFIFDQYQALLVNVLWGFSTGAINSVLIFRPYALLTCVFVLMTFCVFRAAHKKSMGNTDFFLLFFTMFCGILTHYHFFIFATMVLFCFFVFLMIQKRYEDLVKSLLSVLISFLTACLCYHPIIKNIYGLFTSNLIGYHQVFVFDNVLQNAYVSLSVWLLQTVGGAIGKIVFWAAIAFILFLCIKFLIDKKQIVKINFFTIIPFTGILFILTSWQFLIHRNWYDTRYLWPAYPVAVIFLVFLINTAVNFFFSKNLKKKFILVALIILFTAVPFFENRDIMWLYSDDTSITKYKNALVIGINDSTDSYALLRFSGFVYDLSQTGNFIILGKEPEKELDMILQQKDIASDQILFLVHYLTSPAAINSVQTVLKKSDYSDLKPLFAKTQITVFLSVKNNSLEK